MAIAISALAISPTVSTIAFADDPENKQAGRLECTADGGVGLIRGSRKKVACTFTKEDGTEERYEGRVTKIGSDIGVTIESNILWAAYAPSRENGKGGLAGKYSGVGAEATEAGGIGANALFSVDNNFPLQPFSVQGQEGLNTAAGLEKIILDYVE